MHQFFFPKKEYPAYYRPAEGGEKIKDPLSRGVDNNLDRRRHAASAAYGGRAAFPSAESSRLLRESRASRPPAWSCGMEGARSASIGRADRASSEGAVKCHAERSLCGEATQSTGHAQGHQHGSPADPAYWRPMRKPPEPYGSGGFLMGRQYAGSAGEPC